MKRLAHLIFVLPFLLLLFAGCGHTPAKPVFNVPTLVGLKIDGVTANLGKPTEFTDPNTITHPPSMTEWDATWKKGRVGLLVTYNLQTGKVVDFFIISDDPSGASSDVRRMRELGALKENDPRYTLQPVPAMGHPGKYTGVKVTPN